MKKIGLIIIVFLFLGIISSCGDKEPQGKTVSEESGNETEEVLQEAKTETEDLTPVEPAEYHQGMITYFSGDVFILDNGEWWEVAIGDLLEKDDTLKTESASYCEIQFGDAAVVRVKENTEVTMRKIALAPGEADVNVGMNEGSVLAKVKKLGGDESFKVQTQTAVCGVRGTEFSVAADKTKGTNLAVKEGSVAVLPSTVDIDKLKEKVGTGNEDLVNIIEDMESAAPLVEANQEIEIDETTMKGSEEAAKLVEKVIDEIVETAKAEQEAKGTDIEAKTEEGEEESSPKPPVIKQVDPEKLANLKKAVEKTKEEITRTVIPPKEVTKENSKKLQEIDKMKIIEIPVKTAETDEGETVEETVPKVTLVKVSISTNPADAVIILDGDQIGKGKFSGIYPEGEELNFTISREGYVESELKVEVSEGTGKLYKVQLAQKPGPEKEEEKEAEKTETAASMTAEDKGSEKEPEIKETKKEEVKEEKTEEEKIVTAEVRINTAPGDAVIKLDGKNVGTGTFQKVYDEGEELEFTVERKGYEPSELEIEVGKNDITKTVTLVPKTVQYVNKVSNGKLVGTVQVVGNLIIAADSNGVVTAVDGEGNQIWSIATANAPNENSFPVPVGGNIFFSGSKELVVMNTGGGVINRVPLDSGAAHLFGRRVVPSSAGILLPTNGSIRIINGAGNNAGEVPLPKGSRMTPAVWNNKIVIGDQQGSLLVLNPSSKNPVEAEISTAAVQPVALAPTVVGDYAVFSGRKGNVVCVDLASRQVVWEKPLAGGASVFSDIASNGEGLYAFAKGIIFPLSFGSGGDLFAPIGGAASAPLCHGTNIMYGTGNRLVIQNGFTGAIVKNITLPGRVSTKPAMLGDKVVVGTDDGRIMIINP